MASLFQSLRWIHIAAGSIALILFWIPAIARKGGRTHIRAGWFYVACMSVVVVTALGMSGLAFTMPVAVRQTAILWVLPSIVGVFAIFATIAYYQRNSPKPVAPPRLRHHRHRLVPKPPQGRCCG
jgi:hypothetical protein